MVNNREGTDWRCTAGLTGSATSLSPSAFIFTENKDCANNAVTLFRPILCPVGVQARLAQDDPSPWQHRLSAEVVALTRRVPFFGLADLREWWRQMILSCD